jgi:hypothetical protein
MGFKYGELKSMIIDISILLVRFLFIKCLCPDYLMRVHVIQQL